MKNRIKRIETFSFFNHQGICRRLEDMAAKGWLIEHIGNFSWTYRRIEPQRLKFAISYYPKASAFDPEPSEEQQIFYDFCAHTGWQLACSSAQLQIFYNAGENPRPLQTEPTLEVQSIHAAAKKGFIIPYILLLLMALLNGGLFISSLLGDPIGLLASPTRLFSGFCFLLLFILCLTELACYFIWHARAQKAAEQGEFLTPISTSFLQKLILLAVFIGAAYWLINLLFSEDSLRRWLGIIACFYMPLLILLVNGTKNLLKKLKAPRRLNFAVTLLVDFVMAFAIIAALTFGTLKLSDMGFFAKAGEQTYEHNGITWVIHNDNLPLTLADLIPGFDESAYIKARSGDESLLLGQADLQQHPRFDAPDFADLPRLDYTMVLVKIPALYEICRERMLREPTILHPMLKESYRPTEAEPWGANLAYQLYNGEYGPEDTYLLCYDNLLVQISFSWPPTQGQMQIAGQRLNP